MNGNTLNSQNELTTLFGEDRENSNNKFRGARMTAENKMKVNFLYANAGLKLQDLTLRQ